MTKASFLMPALMIGVLVGAVVLAFGPAVFNLAQISRLHGLTDSKLYELASAIIPDDVLVQWQAGVALASQGDYKRANEILAPLGENGAATPEMLREFLNVLVAEGQLSRALLAYAQSPTTFAIAPGSAAALLAGAENGVLAIPAAERYRLSAQLFGLDPQRADVKDTLGFLADARTPQTQEFDRRLQAAAQWRSLQPQPRVPLPSIADIGACSSSDDVGALGAAIETVGANLVVNGNLEAYDFVRDQPVGWTPTFANQGDRWSIGAFVVGVDNRVAYSGLRSLRFDGLSVAGLPGRDSARAGYQGTPLELEPDTYYVMCFAYRDNLTDEPIASLRLSEGQETPLSEDYFFPPSGGVWKKVNLLFKTQAAGKPTISPLLRIWKTGTIWMDNITLREVQVSAGYALPEISIVVTDAESSIPN